MTLAKKILNHRKLVLVIFILAAAVCAVLQATVGVDYDLMDYLPKDAPSTIALNVMDDEYSKAPPNARVMIPDVTVPQALAYKEKIKAVQGVDEVNWLDDAVNIDVPLETMPRKTLDSWYKDGDALYTVTISKEHRDTAIAAIKEIIGPKAAISGDVVNLSNAAQSTSQEVPRMMYIAVPIVLVVLMFTTTSWFEPLLFLASIFAAILLNMGTNVFVGEISFVTKAAGSILQLAVSLDLSIFLLHRFAEFRREGMPVQEAMENAMTKAFASIFSSGVTLVIGFAALIFMQFRIGPDMGVVMAKAIVFSLLSVLIFLPALSVSLYKLIDKTHHRAFIPPFSKFGKAVVKIGVPVMVVFALLITPSYLAQGKNTFAYGTSGIYGNTETEIGRANAMIDGAFGKSDLMVLLVPKGDLAREKQLYDDLMDLAEVKSIISYVGTVGGTIPMEYVPQNKLSELISEHYSRMVVTLDAPTDGPQAFAFVEKVRALADKYYPGTYHLAGQAVNTYDLRTTVQKDKSLVDIISICAVFLTLVLVFRSLSLPLALILVIETSIWINLSIPYFSSTTVFYIDYLLVSSIQLGSTVDYAILLASRYMENRRMMQSKAAAETTLAQTTVSILTSALILCTGATIMGFISSNAVISQIGFLIGRGAAISAACVLLVQPALLRTMDAFIQKTTFRTGFQKLSGGFRR